MTLSQSETSATASPSGKTPLLTRIAIKSARICAYAVAASKSWSMRWSSIRSFIGSSMGCDNAMVEETSWSINDQDVSLASFLRQEWRVMLGFGVVMLVAAIEPQWAFDAIRYASAMIYALLLALSS